MNKIDKLDKELEKAREKAAEWQAKIRELEKQKQEEENSQIVQAVRSLKLTPAQLMAFLNDPKTALPLRAILTRSRRHPERRTQPMKKTKYRRLAAMAASLLCCLIFTVPAYAQSSEPQPEATPAPVETEAEPETQNPFTPDGTGTVVDNATDEDGKEFYTITTADESVFYLVIDKQKTSENVYFLNTVTTDDLLPLAEQGKEPPKEVTPEPEPKPTEPVEEVPEPEPEKKDSPLLSLLLIGAVVLAGGGIGYYFKIYKPKHEAPDLEDDYCEYEDGELEEIAEEPEDEDTPPWEEDTEE